ncbi:MAG: carboxypeptidase-like regulatory domain-containing protein, partial [Tannerellaceae bacterium]|nr:carboxypeptidase-like regulatory domain-containing protein [Tannerellaceae bacterium]
MGSNVMFNKGCRQTLKRHPLHVEIRMAWIIAVFLFHINTVCGQKQVQGVTVDADNKPVKYVDIGFEGKGLGTVSDANGVFLLDVPDSLKDEPLTFSHVSYNTKQLLIRDISQNQTIVLEEKVFELPEVSVNPQKISFKRLKKGVRMFGDMGITGLGGSVGVVLNIKKESLLKYV